MNNYEELEKIYYKKKRIEYIQKGFFLFIIIAILYFFISFLFLNTKPNIKSSYNSYNKESNNKKIGKVEITQKLSLNPIFPKVIIKEDREEITKEKKEKKEKNKTINNQKIVNQHLETENLGNNEIDKNSENKNSPIKIVVQTKEPTIEDFIKSFNNSLSYDMAIKISKLYLKNSKYEKSIEWAKKANNINPENYESWYFFAKSLVKLGKRKKAEKILKAYIESYGKKPKIENLLRSLK